MEFLDRIFGSEKSEDIVRQEVIETMKKSTKKDIKQLHKNTTHSDIKTPLDEYYYDSMTIPSKYELDFLPQKRYDYAFNSEDKQITLGITFFGKQNIAGYDLDICEIVYVNNVTNTIIVLENVLGILDRKMLKGLTQRHEEYINVLINKVFNVKRLDKIILDYKGHFGMIIYNSQKNKFQLCTITPVVEKLSEWYSYSLSKRDIIPITIQ